MVVCLQRAFVEAKRLCGDRLDGCASGKSPTFALRLQVFTKGRSTTLQGLSTRDRRYARMAETDELLAAEEEYQAQKRQRHIEEDGWAEAQPDAGLPPKRDDDQDGGAGAAAAEEEPSRKKPKLTAEDKKRGSRMFGAMMVCIRSPTRGACADASLWMQGTLSRFKDDTAKTRQTEAVGL